MNEDDGYDLLQLLISGAWCSTSSSGSSLLSSPVL